MYVNTFTNEVYSVGKQPLTYFKTVFFSKEKKSVV